MYMKSKQFFAGVTLSALLGGGIAVGGYKLADSDTGSILYGQAPSPQVQYTSAMRSRVGSGG